MRIRDLYFMCDSLAEDATFMVYLDEEDYIKCSERYFEYEGRYHDMSIEVHNLEVLRFKILDEEDTIFILIKYPA